VKEFSKVDKRFNQIQIPTELINFYQGLKEVQDSFIGENTLKTSKVTINQSNFANGESLIYNGIKVNYRNFTKNLKEISFYLKQQRPLLVDEISKIETIFKYKKDELWPVVENFILQKQEEVYDYCKSKEINLDIFVLILVNTLRPLLQELALSLHDKYKDEFWHKNYCPVCGWHPSITTVEPPDNKRYLHCSMCATKWSFKRLACVNCNNEDHTKLGYLRSDQLEGYQVDFCQECNHYIKTIFTENRIKPIDNIEIIDLDTLYLDIIAESKGYIKHSQVADKKTN
jgi:FdhE protein